MVTVILPQRLGTAPAGLGVRLSPAIGARATGDPQSLQFARLGQVMVRGGLGIAEAAAGFNERVDIAAIKEAQAVAEERIVDADRDYFNRTGKSATGIHRATANEGLQSQLKAISDGLAPGRQQDGFRLYLARRMPSVQRRWNQHEDQEGLAYEIGARQALITQKKDAAIRVGPQDPGEEERKQEAPEQAQAAEERNGFGAFSGLQGALRQGLGEQPDTQGTLAVPGEVAEKPLDLVDSAVRETAALGRLLGKSPEQIQLMELETTTDIHAGRINDMLRKGQGSAALDYLGRKEDQIEAVALGRLRSTVQASADRDVGAATAQEVMEQLDIEQHRREPTPPEEGVEVVPPEPDAPGFVTGGSFGGEGFATAGGFGGELTAAALGVQGTAAIRELWTEGKLTRTQRDFAFAELERLTKERRNSELNVMEQANQRAEEYLMEHPLSSVADLPADVLQIGRERGLVDDWNNFSGSMGRYGTRNRRLFTDLWANRAALRGVPEKEVVTTFRTKFNPRDFAQVMSWWETANKVKNPKHSAQAVRQRHIDAGLAALFADSEFDWAQTTRTDPDTGLPTERFYRWNDALQTLIDDFELTEKGGQPATSAEIQSIVSNALQNVAYTADGDLLPMAAMTADEQTGLTRRERQERIDAGQSIEDAGAFTTADQMATYLRRHGGAAVPETELEEAEQVFLGNIPNEVSAEIVRILREDQMPDTAAGRAAVWFMLGRPETVAELRQAQPLLTRERRQ